MKKNDWAARFGAKRRAIDRAILAEAERAIAAEGHLPDPAGPPEPQIRSPWRKTAPDDDSARSAIARAFGRPVGVWR